MVRNNFGQNTTGFKLSVAAAAANSKTMHPDLMFNTIALLT